MALNRYVLLCVVSLMFFGCQENISVIETPDQRTVLIDEIESYSTIEEIKEYFGKRSYKYELLANDSFRGDEYRAPFIINTIHIEGYMNRGITGTLDVSFFNDRVIETTFYPSDFENYLKVLSKELDKELNIDSSVMLSPNTELWVGVRYLSREGAEKKCVSWIDIRLDDEMGQWIKKNA